MLGYKLIMDTICATEKENKDNDFVGNVLIRKNIKCVRHIQP